MFGFSLITILISLGVFAGSLAFFETGRFLGIRSLRDDPDGEGVGTIEATLFALLGLLLAFTFSGAAARFDTRRQLVVDEANAIGTAYLRIDLLPPDAQGQMRERFKQYVDSRLEIYRKLSEESDTSSAEAHSKGLQTEIWSFAVAKSGQSSTTTAGMLLLPALNQMFDITTTRTMSRQMHPPEIIFLMLVALILVAAALVGFSTAKAKTRSWLHIILFSFVFALTFYVILDIEYPRMGLIRVDAI
jgi:hypothetical protein